MPQILPKWIPTQANSPDASVKLSKYWYSLTPGIYRLLYSNHFYSLNDNTHLKWQSGIFWISGCHLLSQDHCCWPHWLHPLFPRREERKGDICMAMKLPLMWQGAGINMGRAHGNVYTIQVTCFASFYLLFNVVHINPRDEQMMTTGGWMMDSGEGEYLEIIDVSKGFL